MKTRVLTLFLGGAVLILSLWWFVGSHSTPIAAAPPERRMPPTVRKEPAALPPPPVSAWNGHDHSITDRFVTSPVVSDSETTTPDGVKLRLRVVKSRGKYPLLRVEDRIGPDPVTGAETLLSQQVMVADHVLVKLKDGAGESRLQELLRGIGAFVRRGIPNSNLRIVGFPARDADALTDAVKSLGTARDLIEYAEPDYVVGIMTIPNDNRFSELWAMNNTGQNGGLADADIDAPEAWSHSTGSHSVLVCVIDTGLDATHPDLAANLWTNPNEIAGNGIDDDSNGYIDDVHGWDFLNEDNNPADDHGHGTHCAGTIGAYGNNNQGVAGVCWNVSLLGLKFLGADGYGYTSDAAEATLYATRIGAKLTSNSWGGGGYTQGLKDAIDAADGAGVLYIAAAGNNGMNMDGYANYPSGYDSPNIIAVAATDFTDVMAGFSNFGKISVDLGAPGDNILSCAPGGGYVVKSGTSMAAPHVAGACALLWSHRPAITHRQVKDILLESTDAIASTTGRCVSDGRLNIANAMETSFTVSPFSGVTSTGLAGGPFTPSSHSFVVTNQGDSPMPWTVAHIGSWLDLSTTGGTLAAGESVTVVATTNGNSATLPIGTHADVLTFTDLVHSTSLARPVQLDVTDSLRITPASGLACVGHPGGPFAPANVTYSLDNVSGEPVTWRAYQINRTPAGPPLLQCYPTEGTLLPGDGAVLLVIPSADCSSLPLGQYMAELVLRNGNTGRSRTFPVSLSITPDYFTEIHDTSVNDTGNHSFTFTPDGSSGFYAAAVGPSPGFPTDPNGGIPLPLGDDQSIQVVLNGGAAVSLYGVSHTSFHVGSNGYITFGSGDSDLSESLADHFRLPRISALFDDLNPAAAGSVSWKQLTDRAAVTYQNVPEFSNTGSNSFQIEMFFDGRIRITLLGISAGDGLIGLSRGTGLPADFAETDFSAFKPAPPVFIRQPASVTGKTGGYARLQFDAVGVQLYDYHEWRHNGVPVPNVWGPTLYLDNLQAGDAGTYQVILTNEGGTVASETAVLTVSDETIANGSFETDLGGWTSSGNVTIQSGAPYTSTDGTSILSFNAVNTQPNGVLTQSFATQPGSRYALDFDVGIIAYNFNEQRMQVDVAPATPPVSDLIALSGHGNGSVVWEPRHYEFVADGHVTTITFRDVSTTSDSIDLLLDHVRINSEVWTLIGSSPVHGVPLTISPVDLKGSAGGTTPLYRSYFANTTLTITAPVTDNGMVFERWVKNGFDLGTNPVVSTMLDEAVYQNITAFYLPIARPQISSAGSATAIAGHLFTYSFTATNFPTQYGAAPLPEGLALSGAGFIDGIPTTPGTYEITLSAGNHLGTDTRTLNLTILPAPEDYFTEQFYYTPNDTVYQSFTFAPDVSVNHYTVRRSRATAFPTDPKGGTPLAMAENLSIEIPLDGGKTFPFFGIDYASVFAGKHGYITFGSSDDAIFDYLGAHFLKPRISGMFHWLEPDSTGDVSWKQTGDRLVVTYQNVPEYTYGVPGGTGSNSFQIEMFFDGRIRITVLGITSPGGIIGLSQGMGTRYPFPASDFSNYPLENGLAMSPANKLQSSGYTGIGPFLPSGKTYTLANHGTAPVSWTASTTTHTGLPDSDWLAVSPASGNLDPGAIVDLQLSVTPKALNLHNTAYTGTLLVSSAEGDFKREAEISATTPPPQIVSPTSAHGRQGFPFTYQIACGGGFITGYGATGLPTGLTLNSSTGLISGKPGVYGSYYADIAATGDGGTTHASLLLTIDPLPPAFLSAPDGGNPVWQVQGEWAYGTPSGRGGTGHGGPDPTAGATGGTVFGVNLNGDYSVTPGGPYCLTAGPFDLRQSSNTVLRFQRWLNTDSGTWTRVAVEVSTNGVHWSRIWANGNEPISDSSWNESLFDISLQADHQPVVFVRWSYETKEGAYPYSGWNIDDVQFLGDHPLIVTTLADENDPSPGMGTGDSLREMIAAAAAIPGLNDIRFAPALNGGTIVLGNGLLQIVDGGLNIDAGDLPDGIVVSGNHTSQVFRIVFSSSVVMNGLTIAHASGGAIEVGESTLDLTDCVIRDNTSSSGGAGLFIPASFLTYVGVSDCTFTNNSSGGDGGAIHNDALLGISGSTFSGNHSDGMGGAIRSGVYRSGMSVGNSTFTGNTAGSSGGAIAAESFRVSRCTVSGNSALTSGGGIHRVGTPGIPELGFSLADSIVAGNSASVDPEISGAIDIQSGMNYIGGNPRLSALGAHGGNTMTMPPLFGSPVLDAAGIPGDAPPSDQRGFKRISGAAMDIGAVEVQKLTVDTLADESDGSEAGGVSLRDAVNAAVPLDLEWIDFSPALDGGTITLQSGPLAVTGHPAIIASPLAAGITIDGGAATRILDIAADASLALDSLCVTRGKSDQSGGAIRNAGTLTLKDCTVSHSLAFVDGGGIANSGTLSLVNSTVAENLAAAYGGGIANSGTASLVHSTVSENTAFFFSGGGVSNLGTMASQNSIIAGNHASSLADFHGTPPATSGNNLLGGDPVLAPLDRYDGPTPTMPPLAGSPVIDAGVLLPATPPLDQRKHVRPTGPLPDLGAVEAFPFSTLVMTDTDADQIDDRLEAAYGLTVGVDDSAADSDGDGSRDAEEMANMTDPHDANSRLKILSFVKAPEFTPVTNPVFDITFTTFPGLSYKLECDTRLDFHGPGARSYPLGVADDFLKTFRLVLHHNGDFVRVCRTP